MLPFTKLEKDLECEDKLVILQSFQNQPTEVMLLTYTEKYKLPGPVMDSEIFFTVESNQPKLIE